MGVGSEHQGPRNPGNSTKGKTLAVGGGGGNLCNWGRPSCGGEPGAGEGRMLSAQWPLTPHPQEHQPCFGGVGVANKSPR